MILKDEFENWYENHTNFTDYEGVKQIWEACENCMIETRRKTMEKLIESLTRAEHNLGFLREDLQAASKAASLYQPLAHLYIVDLIAMQAALEIKASAFLANLKKMK